MYNPSKVDFLGKIPDEAHPFWVKPPDFSKPRKPSVMPQVPTGYKLMLYYYSEDIDDKLTLNPRYIIVPEAFSPLPGEKPTKVPVGIRSNTAYANGMKPVLNLDMTVSWKDNLTNNTNSTDGTELGAHNNTPDNISEANLNFTIHKQ